MSTTAYQSEMSAPLSVLPLPSATLAARPAQILTFPPTGPSRLGHGSIGVNAPSPCLPSYESRPSSHTVDLAFPIAAQASSPWETPHFRSDASTSKSADFTHATSVPDRIDALARRVGPGLPTLNPELSRHLYEGERDLFLSPARAHAYRSGELNPRYSPQPFAKVRTLTRASCPT